MTHYQHRRSSPWKLWIIPLLFLGLIVWLGYEKKDLIFEKLGVEVVNIENKQTGPAVGDELTLSGPLSSSNNLRHYTMMLTSAEHGVVGVKSTMMDLSSYRGKNVTLRGKVTGVINNIPVIDVASVVSDESNTPTPTVTADDKYVSAAGMILDPMALKDYTIKTIGPDSVTFVAADDKEVELSYFACTNDKTATDCGYMLKQFQTAESRFTGVDGDEWFQLPETNAWFGTNDKRIGYKIPDVEKSVITDLMHGVTFVNDSYVSKKLLPEIKNVCKNIEHTLNYTDSSSVTYQQDKITITVKGTDTESTPISCVVSANPADVRTMELVSLIATGKKTTNKESVQEEQNTEKNTNTRVEKEKQDGSAEPAPTENTDPAPKLGTALPFTSSKGGYTIVFPSNNISFRGLSNRQSLGIEGVRGCWSQMNVIAYANAQRVTQIPAVIMYDCRDVAEDVATPAGYIRKDGEESGKTFFIKVINPAWQAFAEAIEVK